MTKVDTHRILISAPDFPLLRVIENVLRDERDRLLKELQPSQED